jgi:hypothetical protein
VYAVTPYDDRNSSEIVSPDASGAPAAVGEEADRGLHVFVRWHHLAVAAGIAVIRERDIILPIIILVIMIINLLLLLLLLPITVVTITIIIIIIPSHRLCGAEDVLEDGRLDLTLAARAHVKELESLRQRRLRADRKVLPNARKVRK